jgi:hypothetical protein
MCTTGQQPSSVTEALDAVEAGLAYLNGAAVADLPGVVQAECLRGLARAESAHTAARARCSARLMLVRRMKTMVRAARGCGCGGRRKSPVGRRMVPSGG